MLQMGIQPEKGEKNDMGEPSIGARPTTLFSKAAYIPQVVHKEIMEYAEVWGAAVLTLIETRLSFCIPSRIQKVLCGFTSSSGQGAC